MRLFKASLALMPETRTAGAFGHDQRRLEWVQSADLWQALLYRHSGTFFFNGQPFKLSLFDLIVVPPGSRCAVEPLGELPYVYNYMGFAPVTNERDLVALPLHTPLGDDGLHWDLLFRNALNRVQFTRTPIAAYTYALLWSIAQPEARLQANVYVEAAVSLLEERLHETLRIGDLARELGISQSQLTRLFVLNLNLTPLQVIRDRRATLAQRLLTSSTDSIKSVGAACGMPNVHVFNRFCRDRLGASPRAIRAGLPVVDVYRVKEYGRAKKTRQH